MGNGASLRRLVVVVALRVSGRASIKGFQRPAMTVGEEGAASAYQRDSAAISFRTNRRGALLGRDGVVGAAQIDRDGVKTLRLGPFAY